MFMIEKIENKDDLNDFNREGEINSKYLLSYTKIL